jgi:hypothetical protein
MERRSCVRVAESGYDELRKQVGGKQEISKNFPVIAKPV